MALDNNMNVLLCFSEQLKENEDGQLKVIYTR